MPPEKCPYCNKQVNPEWRFCKHCNKPLIVNLKVSEKYTDSEKTEGFAVTNTHQGNLFRTFDSESKDKLNALEDQIEGNLQKLEPIGSLLLEKAGIYYNNRDFSNSLKILKEALEAFQEEKNRLKIAITHNQIGLILEEKGFYDEAIYHFDDSLKILKQLQENAKLIKVYNNIANAYYLIQDIEQAYSYYKKALNLAKKEDLMDDVIKTNSNLAEILIILNQFEEADQRLQQNLRYFQNTNEIYGMVNTYNKLGKLYFLKNTRDYETSISFLNKALNLIEQIQEKISPYMKAELEWESYFYLGKTYLKKQEIKKAENHLFLSLDAVRTYHPRESINEALVLETLAKVYEIKEEFSKSIEYYTLANKIFSKFGQDEKKAKGTYKIGQIYLELSKLDKALRKFENALQLYEELEYIKQVADIHHAIGKIYLKENLVDLAISSFREAQHYYKEIQDVYHVDLLKEKINSLK
ncbi:MAG: tetratricopeptide repeat protein [Promethearchaeia archaeon]